MSMNNRFVELSCFQSPYKRATALSCKPFSCGEHDLDAFFNSDAFEYEDYKMGRSYCLRLKEHPDTIVAIYTLSCDSIRIYDLPRSRRDAMLRITQHRKRLKRYPAILIGRLGVSTEYIGRGVGSQVLDVVKQWYGSSTISAACRFLMVDAINNESVIAFYQKNKFKLLFSTEQQEDFYVNPPKNEEDRISRLAHPVHLNTRLMFYDLLDE